jgi:predicted transcriptional regulator
VSTISLKAQINELLNTVEDERFLKSITAMLQTYVAEETIPLTSEERAAVERGLQDVEAGRLISHQQVKQNSQARYPGLNPKSWK